MWSRGSDVCAERKSRVAGFSLVEALIAAAVAAAVLLPALGVFSLVVRGSAEASRTMRAHTAADVKLRSAAAALRVGDAVEEIATLESPVRMTVRAWQGGDSATNRVEVVYDAGGGARRKVALVMPPQPRGAKAGDAR